MIIAMARDPRVLVIKVADRLHNMRTMRFLPPEKQARKARETLEVIAPACAPAGHGDGQVGARGPVVRDPAPQEATTRSSGWWPTGRRRATPTSRRCAPRSRTPSTASKINATVEGRPKHYWSIYQKMIVKGRDFDEIHDLVGVRVLCDEIRGTATPPSVRALAVAADGGPVQGLHRPAEVRGLPVAAHHRRRPRGQAAGGADPHPRDAPHRRVRHRRALAIQGVQGPQRDSRQQRCRRARRHGLDAPAARLAAGGRRPR